MIYYAFYLATPLLGLFRDYSKHKIISPSKFIRSPSLYLLIYLLLYSNESLYNPQNYIFNILIYERWVMLLYKTGKSIYNNDYEVKKDKYLIKYKK
tara:strand:- start:1021 stop:1308 length:288 start_codon:yes stop_codon:yes gene_type:complete